MNIQERLTAFAMLGAGWVMWLLIGLSVIGVAMKPGATQFAVTHRLAYSAPSVLIMPIMPALAAV